MDSPPTATLTRDEAIAYLNSDKSPFATETATICGVEFEVFTHAPIEDGSSRRIAGDGDVLHFVPPSFPLKTEPADDEQ